MNIDCDSAYDLITNSILHKYKSILFTWEMVNYSARMWSFVWINNIIKLNYSIIEISKDMFFVSEILLKPNMKLFQKSQQDSINICLKQ